MNNYKIVNNDNKFVIYKNGKPLTLPKSNNEFIEASFESYNDAEKYLKLVAMLKKNPKY